MMESLFAHVCGQTHVWALGGEPLPFCQRCTGLYVGGFLAVLLNLSLRPQPTQRLLWLHGLLLLQMPAFGYGWIPHDDNIRTLTGLLFAFGLVYYLSLSPVDRLGVWVQGRKRRLSFAVGGLLSIAGVLAAVHRDDLTTGTLLSWAGLFGLIAYAVLVATNIARLTSSLVTRARIKLVPHRP